MTPEETEKTIGFLLEQQAQAATRNERIDSQLAKLADAQVQYEARLGRLEESFTLLVQLASKTDGRLDALTAAQAHTDERLGAFIITVERYISGNGKV